MDKEILPQKKPKITLTKPIQKPKKIPCLDMPQQMVLEKPKIQAHQNRLQQKPCMPSQEDERSSISQEKQQEWFRKSNQTKAESNISCSSKNNLKQKLKSLKVKNLDGHLDFDFKKGDNEAIQGMDELINSKNLIGFMEYVMEFKLHLKASYQNQKTSSSSRSTAMIDDGQAGKERKLEKFQKSSKEKAKKIQKISLSELKEKYKKMNQIHRGYACDGCNMEPIIGKRYHCNNIECWQDYDLCQQCFIRKGHQHEMKIIESNGMLKQIEGVENMITSYETISKSVVLPNNQKPGNKFYDSSIN